MPDPADHVAHDQLLVAAYAAGDASGRDLATASSLVATCPECAALHRDLRSLSSALSTAPAPVRPRDFRITAEQAAALARPTGWRRILAPLSGARSAAGPLAASLAALGLAGLLLGGGVDLGFSGATTKVLSNVGAALPAASGDTALSGGQGNFGVSSTGGQPNIPAAAASVAPSAAPSVAASAGPVEPSAAASMASVPSAAASAAASQEAALATNPPAPTFEPVTQQTSDKSATAGAAADASAPADSGGANMAPQRPSASAAALVAAPPASSAGPSLIVLASLALLVAGVVLGLLRLAARRLV